MAFTDIEIAGHTAVIEGVFWSKRRPVERIRHLMRDGQRFDGQSIELFFVRPLHFDPTRTTEEAIAKVTFVRASGRWRIFWKRADLKWHRYGPHPEAASLAEALGVVDQDANGCFFG